MIRLIAKRLAGWAAVFIVGLTSATEKTPIEVLVYAEDGYPPYSYVEAGEARGIYTEIMKLAFARMPSYRVTIEPIPWKRGLALIESGRGFAFYPPYYRPERLFIKLYSIPILKESVAVFCRNEILVRRRPNWPEDYYGLIVGVNRGYRVGGDKFWAAVSSGKILVDEAGNNRQNILKLLAGRVDCYVSDRLSVLWEHARLSQEKPQKGDRPGALVEGAVVSSEHGYLVFTDTDQGRFPFKEQFLADFNAVIRRMQEQGEIDRIVEASVKR